MIPEKIIIEIIDNITEKNMKKKISIYCPKDFNSLTGI